MLLAEHMMQQQQQEDGLPGLPRGPEASVPDHEPLSPQEPLSPRHVNEWQRPEVDAEHDVVWGPFLGAHTPPHGPAAAGGVLFHEPVVVAGEQPSSPVAVAETESCWGRFQGAEAQAEAEASAQLSGPVAGLVQELQPAGLVTELQPAGLVMELQPAGLVTELQPAGLVTELQPAGLVTELQPAGLVQELQPAAKEPQEPPGCLTPEAVWAALAGEEEEEVAATLLLAGVVGIPEGEEELTVLLPQAMRPPGVLAAVSIAGIENPAWVLDQGQERLPQHACTPGSGVYQGHAVAEAGEGEAQQEGQVSMQAVAQDVAEAGEGEAQQGGQVSMQAVDQAGEVLAGADYDGGPEADDADAYGGSHSPSTAAGWAPAVITPGCRSGSDWDASSASMHDCPEDNEEEAGSSSSCDGSSGIAGGKRVSCSLSQEVLSTTAAAAAFDGSGDDDDAIDNQEPRSTTAAAVAFDVVDSQEAASTAMVVAAEASGGRVSGSSSGSRPHVAVSSAGRGHEKLLEAGDAGMGLLPGGSRSGNTSGQLWSPSSSSSGGSSSKYSSQPSPEPDLPAARGQRDVQAAGGLGRKVGPVASNDLNPLDHHQMGTQTQAREIQPMSCGRSNASSCSSLLGAESEEGCSYGEVHDYEDVEGEGHDYLGVDGEGHDYEDGEGEGHDYEDREEGHDYEEGEGHAVGDADGYYREGQDYREAEGVMQSLYPSPSPSYSSRASASPASLAAPPSPRPALLPTALRAMTVTAVAANKPLQLQPQFDFSVLEAELDEMESYCQSAMPRAVGFRWVGGSLGQVARLLGGQVGGWVGQLARLVGELAEAVFLCLEGG